MCLEITLSLDPKVSLNLYLIAKNKKIEFEKKSLQVDSAVPILGVRSSVLLEEEPQA